MGAARPPATGRPVETFHERGVDSPPSHHFSPPSLFTTKPISFAISPLSLGSGEASCPSARTNAEQWAARAELSKSKRPLLSLLPLHSPLLASSCQKPPSSVIGTPTPPSRPRMGPYVASYPRPVPCSPVLSARRCPARKIDAPPRLALHAFFLPKSLFRLTSKTR